MDAQTFRLAFWSLLAATALVAIDAALPGFKVPPGYFAVPAGVLAFLAAGAAFKGRANGD